MKLTDFDIPVGIEEDVIGFDISMDDMLGV